MALAAENGSCEGPEDEDVDAESQAGDKRRRLLQAKEESKNNGRWRRTMLEKAKEISAMVEQDRLTDMAKVDMALAKTQNAQEGFKKREADLRQKLDDKEKFMVEVLKQASDCEERLENQRRMFEEQVEKTAAKNAELQQRLKRIGEDASEKEKIMAEVLKQASDCEEKLAKQERDCEERLENQRRAFEEKLKKAAAENAELQQKLNQMDEDSSEKEQKIVDVLKEMEATHLKRREEISERMASKPRSFSMEEISERMSPKAITESKPRTFSSSTMATLCNTDGSSTPGSTRSSNLSSPVSSSSVQFLLTRCQAAQSAQLKLVNSASRFGMKGQPETIGKDQQASAATNRKFENEELKKRLEKLIEDCAKQPAGNEQLQKETEQLQKKLLRGEQGGVLQFVAATLADPELSRRASGDQSKEPLLTRRAIV